MENLNNKRESGITPLSILVVLIFASLFIVAGSLTLTVLEEKGVINFSTKNFLSVLHSNPNYLDSQKFSKFKVQGDLVGTVVLPDGSFSAYRVIDAKVEEEGKIFDGEAKIEFLSLDRGLGLFEDGVVVPFYLNDGTKTAGVIMDRVIADFQYQDTSYIIKILQGNAIKGKLIGDFIGESYQNGYIVAGTIDENGEIANASVVQGTSNATEAQISIAQNAISLFNKISEVTGPKVLAASTGNYQVVGANKPVFDPKTGRWAFAASTTGSLSTSPAQNVVNYLQGLNQSGSTVSPAAQVLTNTVYQYLPTYLQNSATVASDSITSSMIKDGAIKGEDIGNGEITAAKLAPGVIPTVSTGGDISGVSAGSGLTGGGSTGDVSLSLNLKTSGSGLSVGSSGLSLLQTCGDGEVLKWNLGSSIWECSSDLGGSGSGMSIIQEDDTTAVSSASTIDFLGTDFSVTNSPTGEGNISIDYTNSKIVRSNQTQSISGAWTFANGLAGDLTGDVSGNAGTVTDGVYTSGSYSDPDWITSLSAAKVLPDQSGNSGKVLGTNGSALSWITNSSGVAWGAITGNLSSQSDLATALGLKADASSLGSAAYTAASDYLTPSGSAAGLTNFPTLNQNTTGTAGNITGVLGANSFPALSGDITTTQGSLVTTIGAGKVTISNLASPNISQFTNNSGYITGISWGQITGTLANQSDLNTALGLKANTSSLGTAAFTAAGDYATAAQGTLATNALPSASFTDSAVSGKLLTGYISGAGTISATDSILSAIQKLNGNDATNANLTGVVTSVGNATSIGNGAISNAMLANGAVANLSGTNTGDNAANSNYSSDYRAANFVAGTNYLAPTGSAASLTNFPTFNQNTTGTASNITGVLGASSFPAMLGDVTNTQGNLTNAIAAKAVTLTKMADMATASFLGRNTAGSGAPEVLSVSTAKTMLSIGTIASQNSNSVSITGGTLSGLTGLTVASGSVSLPNGSIANAALANGAVANLSGTNTGDNAANSNYSSDYRAANFVAGTNYLTPTGSAANLTSFPTFNQNTTGTASNITGVLGASSFPAMLGDVTNTQGSLTNAIAAKAVTLSKMADMATASFLGRNTAGSGAPEVLSVSTAKSILSITTGDISGLGTIATQASNNVSITGGTLSGLTGLTVVSGSVSLPNGSIANAALANGAVANLSGTNTGDNAVNSNYSSDYRAANFVAGTNYLAPNGSGASLTGITGDQVLPSQSGQNGKVLGTNGSTVSWVTNSSGVAWGAITGSLSDQSDLNTALSGKLGTSLTSANIFVGNGSGVATGVSMSGDVTIDNTGATTIGATKVTLSKMANMATASFLGRNTAGSGAPEVLSATTAKSILAIATGDVSGLGTIATQASSNVSITGGTIAGLTGLAIRSSGTGAYDLTLNNTENLTAGRTLTLTTGNTARTLNLTGGNLTVSDAAKTLAGAGTSLTIANSISFGSGTTGSITLGTSSNTLAIATTNNTSVTLPTSGTLLNNSLTSANIYVGNGSNVATGVGMSGDITIDNTGATTIGNTKVTFAKMQNVSATNRILGRATSGSGSIEEITVGGDISQSGSTFTIGSGAVTLAKMANMATASFLGRNTAGSGAPEVLSATTAKSILAIATGDVSGLGTIATQASNNVSITGGTLSGLTGLTVISGSVSLPNGSIANAALANGAVANLSGTNSGDNAVNSNYSSDYRAANFVAGTNYLAPNGSGASLTGITGDQVLPSQSGQNGKVLGTNGTTVSWVTNSSGVAWGAITGTLSEQSDLNTALSGKLGTGLTSANIFVGNGSGVATGVGMSGDVTIDNTGATTIGATKVTLSKMANMATASFLGRNTAGSGTPEVLSATTAKSILAIGTGDVSGLGTIATQASNNVSITGGTIAGLTGLAIRSSGTGAFDLTINNTENLTAGRTLTLTTGNAARTLNLTGGNLTISDAAKTLAGAGTSLTIASNLSFGSSTTGSIALGTGTNTLSIATTNNTSVTLPTSGTLLNNSLTSANIYVGNGSNVATGVGMSGDITIDNTGATTIGATKVTFAKMQNVSATNRILGRATAGAGSVEEITVGGDLSQSGSTFTIGNGAVTLAKMANMATASILGRNTAGSGSPEVLSNTTVKSILAIATGDVSGLGTIATQASSNVTLTGGTINGIAIGGSTAAAGAFTTVSASTSFTRGSDTITDFTGNGLTLSTGALTLAVPAAADGLSSTTSSGSGLEVLTGGIALLQGCSDGQILKWTESSDTWSCQADSTSAGGGVNTIKEGGTSVVTSAVTLNFAANDFAITDETGGQAGIAIDYTNSHITRDNQTQSISGAWTFTNNVTINAQNSIRLADSDSSNYVAFKGPATVGTNVTWTLPSSDGTGCFQSDGGGNMSIASCGGGGQSQEVKTFTSSSASSYQIPTGSIMIVAEMWGGGGGGGGGAGANGANNNKAGGGGAGGGGSYNTATFLATGTEIGAPGATIYGVAGAGGTGGGGGSQATGVNGGAGGQSCITTSATGCSAGTVYISAYGGGFGGRGVVGTSGTGGGGGGGGGTTGIGGNASAGTGGTGGSPNGGAAGANSASVYGGGGGATAAAAASNGGSGLSYGGGGGSAGTTVGGNNSGSGGSTLKGGAGGGAGGSINNSIGTITARNGGAGGTRPTLAVGGGGAGGTAGANTQANGTAGANGFGYGYGGSGGGGGASRNGTGTAGFGAGGGLPGGGGGGGGGATAASAVGGNGGNGGRGEVRLYVIKGTASDLAEIYSTKDPTIKAGDVISLDPNLQAGVKKSGMAYDPNVMGIVSTLPSVVMGTNEDPGTSSVLVALAGRVPVKVSLEGGKIAPGDYLTSSSIPGVAMKATRYGPMIGQALTSFDGDGYREIVGDQRIGLVTAFIKNGFGGGSGLANSASSEADPKAALLSLVTGSASAKSPATELSADRITAGLDVITPSLYANDLIATDSLSFENSLGEKTVSIDASGSATFSGTLTAKLIKADQIEGSINDPKLQSLMSVLGVSTDEQGSVSLNTLASLTVGGSLKVSGSADFLNDIAFRGLVTFDRAPVFDKNSAGLAMVPEGSREVEVIFDREYAVSPIVVASPVWDADMTTLDVMKQLGTYVLPKQEYIITNVTSRGFKILLEQPAVTNLKFNWMALAVKDAAMSTGAKASKLTITAPDSGFASLRDNPSPEASESAKINSGETMNFMEVNGSWYKVEYQGVVGWLSGDNIILN